MRALALWIALIAGLLAAGWWLGGSRDELEASAPGSQSETASSDGRVAESVVESSESVERTALDSAGDPGAVPGASKAQGWTRYSWKLVDRFGEPVRQVMVEGTFLGADGGALRPFQQYIGDSDAASQELWILDDQPPSRLRLETGEQGHLPVNLVLPEPVAGGITSLGDLVVPTVAGQFGLPLISGRVLDADGTPVEGVRGSGGVGMGDHEGWHEAGGGVVEIDPFTGKFEMFGPGHLVDSVYVSFRAEERTSAHRDLIPLGTHDIEMTMGLVQVVHLSFTGPAGSRPLGNGFDCQFWSSERLSSSRGYPGRHVLKRPRDATSLRILDPMTDTVLHRFELPSPSAGPLELEHVDLDESVSFIEIRLLDGRGELLDHPAVHLERPGKTPTLRVARAGMLSLYAPRTGGLLRVSLAPGGNRIDPTLTVDLASPPASLQFP